MHWSNDLWPKAILRVCLLLAGLWVTFAVIGAVIDWPAEGEYVGFSEYLEACAIFAGLPPVLVIGLGYCLVCAVPGQRPGAPSSSIPSLEPRSPMRRPRGSMP